MAETCTFRFPHNQTIDPSSLLLSQSFLFTSEAFVMERGPRYKEYSDLRDKKLRKKNLRDENETIEKDIEEKRSILTPPPKKQVKFSSNFATPPRRPKMNSILTQSVPDFASALRKENRKPMPVIAERTPPSVKSVKVYGKIGGGGGSKLMNSTEKRSGGGMMGTRKSYANMEELKGLGSAAGNAINGVEGRVLRSGRVGVGGSKAVLGLRQF